MVGIQALAEFASASYSNDALDLHVGIQDLNEIPVKVNSFHVTSGNALVVKEVKLFNGYVKCEKY